MGKKKFKVKGVVVDKKGKKIKDFDRGTKDARSKKEMADLIIFDLLIGLPEGEYRWSFDD